MPIIAALSAAAAEDILTLPAALAAYRSLSCWASYSLACCSICSSSLPSAESSPFSSRPLEVSDSLSDPLSV